MKTISLATRLIPLLALVCLCLFCVQPITQLFSACNCTAPSGCPVQPIRPCLTPAGNTYIKRFSVVADHGAMTFIGNTLGLSKALCLNEPGVTSPNNLTDAIGAFTTVDPTQFVNTYPSRTALQIGGPAGTTLDWTKNSSTAVLNIPVGSTVIYAELVWSGSYGYYCEDPSGMGALPFGVDPNCVLSFADGPIKFTTPDTFVHMVTADPMTAMISQNPAFEPQNFLCGGNYVRSANVTSILSGLADANGLYTVGAVPATVSKYDNTQNAAGWTLCVIYRNLADPNINNMTFFVANQQGSAAGMGTPAAVTGFCAAPPSGSEKIVARLLVSCIEGDANKTGDAMLLGNSIGTLMPLSGPNNPVNNFFCSQINGDMGQLLNATGTFCNVNSIPTNSPATALVPGGRQGYDITNVDASSVITAGETTAFAEGTDMGDDFMINALGLQISVNAPVIVPIKTVNGQNNITSNVGDIVHFQVVIDNTGSGDATSVFFQDILESGLMFINDVTHQFQINTAWQPAITNADLMAGVSLGTIDELAIFTIDFYAQIISRPASGIFHNFATTPFQYIACSSEEPFSGSNNSNVVTITIPLPQIPPPTDFDGVVTQCKLVNRNIYSLTATWIPVALPTVVSYRIFEAGVLVATIPASGPYIYKTCLKSKAEANTFTIVAVYPNNVQSAPLPIIITVD